MEEYQIILRKAAAEDLDKISKFHAAKIADKLESHLSINPTLESKSKIKKLRGLQRTEFRFKVEPYRIFYNVDTEKGIVTIDRILHKDETLQFYLED